MNAIEFLTTFERDCLKFYETLEREATNPEVKELFGLLVDTRSRHIEALDLLKEAIHESDTESRLIDRAAHVMNGYRLTMHTPDMAKELRNDRDAFEHVIHAEEDMIKLCEGMARVENDENVKSLLTWFIDDEKRHLNEIGEIYEFIEAPHYYLEWGEFSNQRTL